MHVKFKELLQKRSLLVIVLLTIGLLLTSCTAAKPAVTTNWSALQSYARAAATTIDSEAVLYDVAANLEQPGEVDGPIEMVFTFIRPSNSHYIEVRFLDNALHQQPMVNELGDSGVDIATVERREIFTDGFKTVQLGPRDVMLLTLAQGKPFVEARNSLVNPRVILFGPDGGLAARAGIPFVWVITYGTLAGDQVVIAVDPATKNVLDTASTFDDLLRE